MCDQLPRPMLARNISWSCMKSRRLSRTLFANNSTAIYFKQRKVSKIHIWCFQNHQHSTKIAEVAIDRRWYVE